MNGKYINIILLSLIFLSSCTKYPENYTVVVSLDAFRWDYPDEIDTPGLDEIAADGIRCVMEPSYPASTFPNHYTIATGLVPDHNGIVNGSFWNPDTQKIFSMGDSLTRYNPDYYLGEPIWVTAEKAGVKTATIYWVGSDVPIKGVLPSYYYPWWEKPHLTFEQRANEVVKLLSLPPKERPRLVMLYFDEPDETSHKYGPFALQTQNVIHRLDSIVGNMYRQLRALPYGDKINVIVTADHGMTEISNERFIDWDDYLKPSWYERIIGTNPTNIYAKENCIDSIIVGLNGVDHISVWRHDQVPEVLNYGTSNRCGDVIVAPDLGWQFAASARSVVGAHGYSPLEKDMQVIFIASGPGFYKGDISKELSFQNVDIYPMLAYLLSIQPAHTDGSINNLLNVIRYKHTDIYK